MSDLERVVAGLECCDDTSEKTLKCAECPYREIDTCANIARLHADALALLREQEPIKPTISVDTWICSKCGHTLESQELIDDKENPQVLIHEQYQYCPNCGRAVKWYAAD